MRIGIDLDDTICRTTEKVHEYVEKYARKNHFNPLDVMNDEELKDEFLGRYLEDIYQNVIIKKNVQEVIKRLKNKGNEIYIITARSDKPNEDKILNITKEWLKKNKIEVDFIIMNCYGEQKAKACREHFIDLMIDDDPYNYKMITSAGVSCLLFDDKDRYELENYYMKSWLEIEKYIEKHH